jgi:hypothetical protein
MIRMMRVQAQGSWSSLLSRRKRSHMLYRVSPFYSIHVLNSSCQCRIIPRAEVFLRLLLQFLLTRGRRQPVRSAVGRRQPTATAAGRTARHRTRASPSRAAAAPVPAHPCLQHELLRAVVLANHAAARRRTAAIRPSPPDPGSLASCLTTEPALIISGAPPLTETEFQRPGGLIVL